MVKLFCRKNIVHLISVMRMFGLDCIVRVYDKWFHQGVSGGFEPINQAKLRRLAVVKFALSVSPVDWSQPQPHASQQDVNSVPQHRALFPVASVVRGIGVVKGDLPCSLFAR